MVYESLSLWCCGGRFVVVAWYECICVDFSLSTVVLVHFSWCTWWTFKVYSRTFDDLFPCGTGILVLEREDFVTYPYV